MSNENTSVRVQRRVDTLARIHEVAKQLAFVDGLSSVKVDDVAAQSGISRRTFFNYFPTKEDAVLGFQAPTVTEEAVQRFGESSDDILSRTVWLGIAVIRTTTVAGSTAKERRELRKRFPELVQRFEHRAKAADELVRPIVYELLSRSDVEADPEETDVILGMSAAIIRFAYGLDHELKDASITKSIKIFKNTIRKRL